MQASSRREFLADVGRGMLVAGLGSTAATELGLVGAFAADADRRLRFGDLEPLVSLLQEAAPEKVLPLAVARLKAGTSLETLTSAAALANARAFGGNDYTGYHTFMALLPSYQMAGELPTERRALPVLKVLHRNSRRIHDQQAEDHDALTPMEESPAAALNEHSLRTAIRNCEGTAAESRLASLCREDPSTAFNALQLAIQDDVNVHRVVLAWRAWAMLDLAGQQYATSMLRQSVRFCIDAERNLRDKGREPPAVREVLPRLLDEHRLLERPMGTRAGEDAWIEELARSIYSGSQSQAAEAAAVALAEGFNPESVGEAISLAANMLLLNDPGRPAEYSSSEKPAGSVHGDSVGVHASDAANAWRSIARVSNARNRAASLVVGAFHTGGQSSRMKANPWVYSDFVSDVQPSEPAALLAELSGAINDKDQRRACATVQKYGDLGHSERPLFDLLLKQAISEDGALHAEKYYRTAAEEFGAMRPAFRWRQLVALARVTTSEHGYPAPGYTEACGLLGVT